MRNTTFFKLNEIHDGAVILDFGCYGLAHNPHLTTTHH